MAKEDKKKKKKVTKGDGEDKELKDRFTKESLGGKEEETRESEEEMIKKLQEEIDKLTTRDIITQMMMSLSSLAYKKMGIPVGVNDKYKVKQQAKLAIHALDALVKVLRDEIIRGGK